MKKVISLILAVMLVFSLCIFSTSAADVTITPSATVGGQTVTMTAKGVQDSFTLFDIMSIFGSSGGPYTYAFWFDSNGSFSFDKDVTLTKGYMDSSFAEVGRDNILVKAGEVKKISDGVYSPYQGKNVPWTEFYIALDDGNSWMIIDSADPGNYANSAANTPISGFPGTVGDIPAPAPEPEPTPAPAAENPPAENPPAENPPAENPPAENPPAAAPAPAPAPAPSLSGKTYTVVPGDCLWTICQRIYGTGTKWGELWAANASIIANPRLIYPGQVLQLP